MTPSRTSRPAGLALRLRILRAQAGDESAFVALLTEYGPATHRYLATLVGDDADDLQQELWLTVHRRLGDLAHPDAFRTWLFRTARHRAIDRLRQLRRERELFTELDAEPEPPEPPPENRWDPEAVVAAIARLPPLHREAVVLRYLDDLSYGEIALAIGVPIGTVRSRLYHAHRQLRHILDPSLLTESP
jgi:RNA polymerase sigma-70 factor (ECF subfamily)